VDKVDSYLQSNLISLDRVHGEMREKLRLS